MRQVFQYKDNEIKKESIFEYKDKQTNKLEKSILVNNNERPQISKYNNTQIT